MTAALADQIALREIVGHRAYGATRDRLTAYQAAEVLPQDATVTVSLDDPVRLIRTLVALDGQVGSILLLSGNLDRETTEKLTEQAGARALVTDRDELLGLPAAIRFDRAVVEGQSPRPVATRWLMTTSGTTGIPKIVPHTLKSLSRSVYRFQAANAPTWGLLYDPTRFAGLQVVLQALIGGGRLVAADTHRPLGDQVEELAAHGTTHLSATPTLWRRILMVPGHRNLSLTQVTAGGEIADQSTLNALRASFPNARITHIYASTEAGVGFSVNDGKAGFPASYLQVAPGGTKLKLVDGILWLRPAISAPQTAGQVETDAEGFIRSGDMVEERGDRLHFLGRESGLINVGGVKFYPETVEDAVKAVPGVALAQVTTKRNPMTGTLVVAEVQVEAGADPAVVKKAILDTCRAKLVREAVPAIIRFVEGFETNAAGKLVRKGNVKP